MQAAQTLRAIRVSVRREGHVDGKTSPPNAEIDEEERREDSAGSQSWLRDRSSACPGLLLSCQSREVLSQVATARTTSDFNHSSVFKQLGESQHCQNIWENKAIIFLKIMLDHHYVYMSSSTYYGQNKGATCKQLKKAVKFVACIACMIIRS